MKKQKNIKPYFLSFIVILFGLTSSQIFAESKIISYFCEWWKETPTIKIDWISTEKEREICINVWNYWDSIWYANLYFVDWSINANTPNFVWCKSEENEKIDLGKFAYFTDNNWKNTDKLSFSLEPWKMTQVKWKLKFPNWFSWMSYWCLITTEWVPTSEPGKLTVVLRRWSIIKANIWWEIKIWFKISYDGSTFHWSSENENNIDIDKVLFDNSKIAIIKSNWTVYLRTKLENTWNLTMNAKIITNISNSFGFKYSYEYKDTLTRWKSRDVEIPLTKLPFYDGNYNFDVEISRIPVFEFKSEQITEESKKEVKDNFSWSFFVFPAKICIDFIILVLIIIIIIGLIKRRNKKLESIKKEYIAQKWDTLNSIATKFLCDWKKIATLNWIQAPYIIKEWSKIIVYDYVSLKK